MRPKLLFTVRDWLYLPVIITSARRVQPIERWELANGLIGRISNAPSEFTRFMSSRSPQRLKRIASDLVTNATLIRSRIRECSPNSERFCFETESDHHPNPNQETLIRFLIWNEGVQKLGDRSEERRFAKPSENAHPAMLCANLNAEC